ncbi:MAG: cation diffusion facilitator family transporter [Candidatus Promineifilaceae bacterium]|nr:cation diffusion facilitator family transporter [Candidatus Promineifilaceae bacterium]
MLEARRGLTRYAWLSVAAALLTIILKASAYGLTGSVGLLSDALESGVNLVAALVALIVLTIATQPPDEEHAYGHSKAEYFASGVEGTLILIAAVTIAISAVERLLNPESLRQVDIGLAISVVAALLNLVVARVLLRAGRQYRSITLEADAQHLMTDVWTSVGVVVAVAAVAYTGWLWLDPVIALLVAGQILLTAGRLLRGSVLGLMDTALPAEELAKLESILEDYAVSGVQYHALRTRRSGAQRFVSVHIQVPGAWSVQRGHSLLEELERDVRQELPPITVFTHLEPVEDPRSWEDIAIIREDD